MIRHQSGPGIAGKLSRVAHLFNHGLYVHLPFCQKRCPYCHFDISTSKKGRDSLAQLLLLEAKQKGLQGPYDTIFFGGGTPLVADLRPLVAGLGPFLKNAKEVTLEMNPENLPLLKANPDLLAALGVTRVSLGVQSFDEQRLFQLGRGHSPTLACEALDYLLALGVSVNVDLLLCSFEGEAGVVDHNLECLSRFPLHHVSWYGLENPGHGLWASRHENQEGHEALVPLYHHLRQELGHRGFGHYEISNFAKPGHECRHNLGYWLGGTYDTLGPSAAAFDGQTRRVTVSGLENWTAHLETSQPVVAFFETLSGERALREAAVLRLRTRWGVEFSWLNSRNGAEFLALDLGKLTQQGHLIKTPMAWTLPQSLWAQADDILCQLVG